jgi:hypothetical protein
MGSRAGLYAVAKRKRNPLSWLPARNLVTTPTELPRLKKLHYTNETFLKLTVLYTHWQKTEVPEREGTTILVWELKEQVL